MTHNLSSRRLYKIKAKISGLYDAIILSFYDVNTLFRQKEAEALKERMEREKRELQEFIGKERMGLEKSELQEFIGKNGDEEERTLEVHKQRKDGVGEERASGVYW